MRRWLIEMVKGNGIVKREIAGDFLSDNGSWVVYVCVGESGPRRIVAAIPTENLLCISEIKS